MQAEPRPKRWPLEAISNDKTDSDASQTPRPLTNRHPSKPNRRTLKQTAAEDSSTESNPCSPGFAEPVRARFSSEGSPGCLPVPEKRPGQAESPEDSL